MGCDSSKNKSTLEDGHNMIPKKKIIVVGDSGVGKSSLIFSYLGNDVNPNQMAPNIGVKDHSRIVNNPYGGVEGRPRKIELEIWDTAGEEAQRNIVNNFF